MKALQKKARSARIRQRDRRRLGVCLIVVAALFALTGGNALGAVSLVINPDRISIDEPVIPENEFGTDDSGLRYWSAVGERQYTLQNSDRADAIAELAGASLVPGFDQFSMRDIELNEFPPMYRSTESEPSESNRLERMEQAPGLFSSDYLLTKENTIFPVSAASVNPAGEGIRDFQFIEENTILPGASGSTDWSGTLFEYQFVEENMLLPGSAASVNSQGEGLRDYQFIEQNTNLPKAGKASHSTSPHPSGYYELG
jgi:hypothetical protein